MNININFTIIIQALHFFIAYLLVRWAFNPLWLAIKVRRDEQDYLHRSIVGIDHDIDRAKKNNLDHWKQFSAHASDRIHELFDNKFIHKIDCPTAITTKKKEPSDAPINDVIEHLAHVVALKAEGKHGTR